MYRPLQITLVFVTIILSACTSTVSATQTPTQSGSDLLVLMGRGCGWICPFYQLTIEGDGIVTYEGFSYVEVKGIQESQLNPHQIQELITAIEEAGFFEMEDGYAVFVTDLPQVTLSITINGVNKSIWHYGLYCGYETGDAPPELCELENLIDEITNSSQWVGQVDYSDYFDQ